MAESDRPMAPEHMITMKGPLAEMWADARARVAMIPLDKLADSHMQQSTGVRFISLCSFPDQPFNLSVYISDGWKRLLSPTAWLWWRRS